HYQTSTEKRVKEDPDVTKIKNTSVTLPTKWPALDNLYILAWTTTPWTLPSNTALTVGPDIEYVVVKTFNQYTLEPIQVLLAKNLVSKHFDKKFKEVTDEVAFEELAQQRHEAKSVLPYQIIINCTGKELEGIRYEQLL